MGFRGTGTAPSRTAARARVEHRGYTVNVVLAAGIVVGLVVGFVVGRRWAEYFRAAVDARGIMNNRKNYRGKSDLAFVLGGLLILGVLIFYGSSPSF